MLQHRCCLTVWRRDSFGLKFSFTSGQNKHCGSPENLKRETWPVTICAFLVSVSLHQVQCETTSSCFRPASHLQPRACKFSSGWDAWAWNVCYITLESSSAEFIEIPIPAVYTAIYVIYSLSVCLCGVRWLQVCRFSCTFSCLPCL